MKKIGERIKNLRKENNLTQKELGERLNVRNEWISQIENGKKEPSLKLIFQIANEFGVDPGEIITENEEYVTIQKILKESNLPKTLSLLKDAIELISLNISPSSPYKK